MKGINVINNSAVKATIIIDGIIGGDYWWKDKETGNALTSDELRKEFSFIQEIKASIIDVKIMSPGGSVHHALVMRDMLKEHHAIINTILYGFSASAATIIHQAGDKRLVSKYSFGLVHKASNWCEGNENDFTTALEDIRTVDSTIKQIYIDNGVDEVKVNELFEANNGNGKWQTASEFIANGFADGYIEENEDSDKAIKNIDRKVFQNLKITIPEDLLQTQPTNQQTNTTLENFLADPKNFILNLLKRNPMNEKLKKVSDIINSTDVTNTNGVVSLSAQNFEKILDALDIAKTEKATAENTLKLEQEAHTVTKNLVTEKDTEITNAGTTLKAEQDAHTVTKNLVIEKDAKIVELINLAEGKPNVTNPKGSDLNKNGNVVDWAAAGCSHMLEEE